MVIKTLIFSKNRAMQLHATLQSFYLHCLDADQTTITVLYLATNDQTTRQYEILKSEFPQVNFIKENDFRKTVINWLNPYPEEKNYSGSFFIMDWLIKLVSKKIQIRKIFGKFLSWILKKILSPILNNYYFLFLVDDNIFIRDFNIEQTINSLKEHSDALGFSLRLGENTTYCYMLDKPQSLPVFYQLSENVRSYNWPSASYDFNYPLEISSSIYRANEIIPTILGLIFSSPNTLEQGISVQSHQFKNRFPSLLCFEKSVTFCTPINLVQTYNKNRSGLNRKYSIQDLSDRFDRGERIQVNNYINFMPVSCHQEIDIVIG